MWKENDSSPVAYVSGLFCETVAMSLSPITSPARRRNFQVYDFEWVPGTLQMRICGLYDGQRYRCYTTVEDFLNDALTSENRGVWFYAHAGGLADVQFVLEAIINRCRMRTQVVSDDTIRGAGNGYQIEAKFSGSSAIIVDVKRGKNVWHFVDSYWTLRDRLANIGKAIGIDKTGPDETAPEYDEAFIKRWYTETPLHKLIPYNETDNVILFEALSRLQDTLLELGGQLQMTLASCGMSLFRRRFLTREIDTNMAVNDFAKAAYHASRVEVFNRFPSENSYYYDINSSFPHSMTFPCPGDLKDSGRRLPEYADENTFIADCEVTVPDGYFPPLPYRHKNGRVYFPVGTWRQWFTSIDLELLEQEGGRIECVHEVIRFEPFTDLADYAKTIYAMRKATQDPFERLLYKLLMNSLYGKFAESNVKSSFVYNPNEAMLAKLRNPVTGEIQDNATMLFPGAWLIDNTVDIPHMHVPISAHITARSRRSLFTFMNYTGTFDYCDTDGFNTQDKLTDGNELGDIKLEKVTDPHQEGQEMMFLAPKVYKIRGKTPDGKPLEVYKAKGMSLGKTKEEQRRRFEALARGESITVTRMTRLKELYGTKKQTTPEETNIQKQLRLLEGTEKRFTYPDGSTRPWHISELEKLC